MSKQKIINRELNNAPWNEKGAKRLGDNFEIMGGRRECPMCGYAPEKQQKILNKFLKSSLTKTINAVLEEVEKEVENVGIKNHVFGMPNWALELLKYLSKIKQEL